MSDLGKLVAMMLLDSSLCLWESMCLVALLFYVCLLNCISMQPSLWCQKCFFAFFESVPHSFLTLLNSDQLLETFSAKNSVGLL